MTSDTDSSENGFEEFASTALRLQRKGSFEQLLCQHLIVSVSSPLLEKVRLICETAFMVPKDKLSLDFEQVETVYMATLAFLNTDVRGEFIAVAWGFKLTEENYRRFVASWNKGIRLSFVGWNTFDVPKKRLRNFYAISAPAATPVRFEPKRVGAALRYYGSSPKSSPS
jgi:hypothetical protein